jgi:SOUL heme-binding protein
MLRQLAALTSTLVLICCSTVGVRDTEEPAFTVVASIGAVQVRQYGPRLAAETVVDGDEEATRNAGFRRLAGYIFGGNQGGVKIAMTAPVAQEAAGTRIGMTAPVAQSRDAAGRWRIRFFMPAGFTLATLPQPNDPTVALVTVAPETVAVLRFSGTLGADAVAARTGELVGALEGSAWRPAGEPVAWFYDPPWTLPPLRRNEVALPVSPR